MSRNQKQVLHLHRFFWCHVSTGGGDTGTSAQWEQRGASLLRCLLGLVWFVFLGRKTKKREKADDISHHKVFRALHSHHAPGAWPRSDWFLFVWFLSLLLLRVLFFSNNQREMRRSDTGVTHLLSKTTVSLRLGPSVRDRRDVDGVSLSMVPWADDCP